MESQGAKLEEAKPAVPTAEHYDDIDAVKPQDDFVTRFDEAELDAEIVEFESKASLLKKHWFSYELSFKNPNHFVFVLVAFASMGGLLSGLDQSLISGANVDMPTDLGLSSQQASLVNSGMPLGAVAGALILGPCNEFLGRRMSIIVSCILYTIGTALEAGAVNYGMMLAGRLILGAGVGLEG